MDEYINRNSLMRRIETEAVRWGEEYDLQQIMGDIEDFPAADVVEVRHGRWLKIKNQFISNSNGQHENVVKCSVCDEPSASGFKTPYCSICGTKMRGGEE